MDRAPNAVHSPSRRQFLQTGFTAALLLGAPRLPRLTAARPAPDWKPGDPIGYIRPQIPSFRVPRYAGERYDALVPDTLDLQHRARLTIHAMTEATDPLADHEVYWTVDLRSNPAQMRNKRQMPKFIEAMPLLRTVSGSTQNPHVEEKWLEVLLKSLGPDGLYYKARRGRPWDNSFARLVQAGANPSLEQYADPFDCGRVLSAMVVLAQFDGGNLWRDAARGLVDGFNELALQVGDMAAFWPSPFAALKERPANTPLPIGRVDSENSRVPHGLVHAYRLLGYEPALTLAGKVIRFLRRNYFGADGSFWGAPGEPLAHFHAHAHSLLAMEEYAEVTGDQELMEFVVRSFAYAKHLGDNLVTAPGYNFATNLGANFLGYFPEWVNSSEWEGSETCQVTDMITLGMRLCDAGVGDYWDDVDGWVRNMFAEGQLLTTDWIKRVPELISRNVSENRLPLTAVDPYGTTDRVAERNLGAFAGWAAPNDWHVSNGAGIMHCCTGNGGQTIYRVWERILRFESGKLRVNLLLNRASPWADLDSHIPYTGRVDLKIKVPCDVSIRIPEWVAPADVRCQVAGRDRAVGWQGRYALVGDAKPGEVVTLTFPIAERTDIVHIEKERFTLVRKGNEVVVIDPPGRNCPLYQRQHYRANTTRLVSVERFVGDKLIRW